jgi:hypothetical protein
VTQFEREIEHRSTEEAGPYANPLRRHPLAHFFLAVMHEHARAGGAILLHELGAQTRTRDTTNDGVNDPVRAPSGQAPGTAAGSFTPSLVQ